MKARGDTTFEKEGIVVEGRPIQFLPATTALEREAYLKKRRKLRARRPIADKLATERLRDLQRALALVRAANNA